MSPTPLRRNRDFLLLQSGQVLSTIGSESTAIAYPLLVLAITGSPEKAGIVGFARVVPWAIFGLFAGLVSDRLPRKAVMLTSDAIRACALGSVAIAAAVHALTFAQVVGVAFLEGTMFVFFNLSEVGALRSVVAREQLPTAAAAEQARFSTVTLVAPPLGGALSGSAAPFRSWPARSRRRSRSGRCSRSEHRSRRSVTPMAHRSRLRWRKGSAFSGNARSSGRAHSCSPG